MLVDQFFVKSDKVHVSKQVLVEEEARNACHLVSLLMVRHVCSHH